MTTILILAEPVSLARVAAFARGAGLACTRDVPFTGKRRVAAFGDASVVLTWLSRAGSTRSLVILDGEGTPAREDAVRSSFALIEPDALVAALTGASDTVARLRAAFDLAVLCELGESELRTRAVDAIAPLLLDDDRVLRYAASSLLDGVVDRRVVEHLAASVERHPDLAPALAHARKICEAEEDGTLYDGPTDSWWELMERARAGVDAGQWKRVIKASEALLAEDADHVHGLYYRGLAHEAEGDVAMTLAYLGASRAELQMEIEIAEKKDDDESDDDAEELAEKRALLTSIEDRVAALRAREIDEGRWSISREPLVSRLVTWWKDESTCAAGAAEALEGRAGDLEPLFAFLRGAYRSDRALLERAFAAAPDSTAVELRLAGLLEKDDREASIAAYERVLSRLRQGEGGPLSPAAVLIARVDKEPATLSGVLEQLASAAYSAGDRLRALELADELVKVDPSSIKGWQLRGHARLFELRYAEAAEAYADAIREIPRIRAEGEASGSIFFGNDPLPMMHFNRACALGRLGMKEETLDELRLAVRGNEKYAEESRTEEWIQCVWGTPELEAIARKDPRALATKEELEAPFVERLINRCKGHFYRGEAKEAIEVGERAVELASWRGDVEQEVAALSALGYALAFSGHAGRAVELTAKAAAIAEKAPLQKLAEAVNTHAQALHAHGDLDGAERAYRRGLDLRRDAYGADAPVLAKSYGELARLAADQGKPIAEVRDLQDRAVGVLARYLEAHTERDDDWAEAVTDRGTLEVNAAQTLASGEQWDEAARALEVAVTTFERAAEGATLPPSVLTNAGGLAERLASLCEREGDRAREVAARFEALRYPGSPAERRERVFFGRLRHFIERLRRQGAVDEAIARTLQAAVKGVDQLPDGLRSVPELSSFAGEIADRSARWPTFMAMSAMSFGLMETDLDGVLDNLEELAVGYALHGDR